MHFKILRFSTQNFRNLAPFQLELSPNLNCILGKNGHGKTNLLEAIYYLGNNKSFRQGVSFPQIVNMDTHNYEIIFSSLLVNEENDEKLTYSGQLVTEKNNWYLNQKLVRKRPLIPIFFTGAFDSHLFFFQSTWRKNWFDRHFSLIDPQYKMIFSRYTKALKIKNKLLLTKPVDVVDQIRALNYQLAEYNYEIRVLREKYLKELREPLKNIYKTIFSDEFNFKLSLDSNIKEIDTQSITQFLNDQINAELIQGRVLSGIHKDKYHFECNGLNFFEFSSLGQKKMAFLSLVFAYTELFRYKFNSYPLLLLDDISGELDKYRWKNLVSYLQSRNFQVIITTANESFGVQLNKLGCAKTMFISSGKLHLGHQIA